MRGEQVAVPRVFGVFDHQALVLGDLEALDTSHQLSAAQAEGWVRPMATRRGEQDPAAHTGVAHHPLGAYRPPPMDSKTAGRGVGKTLRTRGPRPEGHLDLKGM